MLQQFGNAGEELSRRIADEYSKRAQFITDKNVAGQKSMHAAGFECIATDGRRYPEQRWQQDIELENSMNDYRFSVYSIEKISEADQRVVVDVTRKCSGFNNNKKSFNTEIRLRDEWISESGSLKMMTSETIVRRVWLDGVEMSMGQMRPDARVLLQGCGDYENIR